MGRRRNPRISKKEVAKKALRRILDSAKYYYPQLPFVVLIIGDLFDDGQLNGSIVSMIPGMESIF